jgi:hypothetical protein
MSLDTSLFWNQYCLVRLAVVHRGRALPVVLASAEARQLCGIGFGATATFALVGTG